MPLLTIHQPYLEQPVGVIPYLLRPSLFFWKGTSITSIVKTDMPKDPQVTVSQWDGVSGPYHGGNLLTI
eukprot:s5309_g2.t1